MPPVTAPTLDQYCDSIVQSSSEAASKVASSASPLLASISPSGSPARLSPSVETSGIHSSGNASANAFLGNSETATIVVAPRRRTSLAANDHLQL
ncbi:hypothetical protein C8R44DRAFT_873217 [Mycena epipterygia]|nr:hypothetical protein C8R44DRAFT_873217 [Mycena epipterygia]